MSVIRIGIIAAVIGVLFLIGGVILFAFEQETYRAPLTIEPPADAELVAEERLTTISRRLYYHTPKTPEEVVTHYNELLRAFYSGEDLPERCRRNPSGTASFTNYVPGNGFVPYEYRCMFQRSSLRGDEHATEILIQPGVRNDSAGTDYTGLTRIEHEQYWQP